MLSLLPCSTQHGFPTPNYSHTPAAATQLTCTGVLGPFGAACSPRSEFFSLSSTMNHVTFMEIY